MIGYLRDRLEERTTWAAIGIAVTGAAALSAPYSYIALGVGVVGALVPAPGGKWGGP